MAEHRDDFPQDDLHLPAGAGPEGAKDAQKAASVLYWLTLISAILWIGSAFVFVISATP